MTAAVIWLALKELGASDVALYDEVSRLAAVHCSLRLIDLGRAGQVTLCGPKVKY